MTAAAILNFRNFKFLKVGMVKKVVLCHQAKFRGNRLNCGRDTVGFFDFSRWRLPPSWIFEIGNFCTIAMVKRVELHHRAKFGRNRSNHGRDIAIFWFLKMAVAAVLDFKNFKFLTIGTVKKVELQQSAKFRQNRSNHGLDMVFLDYSRWQTSPSWIFKTSNF